MVVMREHLVVDTDAGHISSWSEGTGRDVLLVHGGPGLSDYMSMLTDETEGWRRIGFQQRGLAPSTTEGPFTPGRHVEDALAVVRAAAREPVVVLGHSFGGYLGLKLALRAPELVRAVVVVDSIGSTGDGGSGRAAAEMRRRLPAATAAECDAIAARLDHEPSDACALELLGLRWPAYYADASSAAPIPADLRLRLDCLGATMRAALDELSSGGFAASLVDLAVPTIVVAGGRSPMPLEVAEETAQLCRGDLSVVRDAGHFPWFERPGCVAEALMRLA